MRGIWIELPEKNNLLVLWEFIFKTNQKNDWLMVDIHENWLSFTSLGAGLAQLVVHLCFQTITGE